jgi:penicillin-binding protein 1A
MSNWSYSEDELTRYFNDPKARRPEPQRTNGAPRRPTGPRSWWHRWRDHIEGRFDNPRLAQAVQALSVLLLAGGVGALLLLVYLLFLMGDMPSLREIENPNFQLATIAYTADNKELTRYASQNRSWVTQEEIPPHVINALVATEDHRFYDHWGIDLFRTMAIPYHLLRGDPQGGSTISQQLARNLYNERIGRKVTVARKLKEMLTAIQIERRYTKPEILVMYLNTVEFGRQAFGIESAARTFFSKKVHDLTELEGATLIGMLQGTSLYDPISRPENARQRRNTVLSQMVKHGHLTQAFFDEHKDDPVEVRYRSSAITESIAPYFAEYVRTWMDRWAKQNGYDLYSSGLVVYTTLDSRLQEQAQLAVEAQMEGLQAVVDYEWSKPGGYHLGQELGPYLRQQLSEEQKFAWFWQSERNLIEKFIRESAHYRSLRASGQTESEALGTLRNDQVFMDSLRASKTRLEAGMVSLDPRTGHVKVWVGGRNLSQDWYDHVARAARQPGSTFKPFVYTAAIDNGWSPNYALLDSPPTFQVGGSIWSPSDDGGSSGRMMAIREALPRSKNTVTARLVMEVGASNVAFYARRMGIQSPLEEVPALALGTSDVTLLELASAYTTLANGGLLYEPTVVTRIEDRNGNVLYEAIPAAREALSEQTAYTMVDILRGSVQFGTAQRINSQFGLGQYDLAGKTGTTQESADGWFMMMHPDLVTGAWVGFNDRRVAFRTAYWGQGAHNALFLVGDFFRRVTDQGLITDTRFPDAADFTAAGDPVAPIQRSGGHEEESQEDRVEW